MWPNHQGKWNYTRFNRAVSGNEETYRGISPQSIVQMETGDQQRHGPQIRLTRIKRGKLESVCTRENTEPVHLKKNTRMSSVYRNQCTTRKRRLKGQDKFEKHTTHCTGRCSRCTYLQTQREAHTHTPKHSCADPASLHIHATNGQIDS